ncbi:MAG: polysaccharide pyruvyl transferase family protein [Chloroflexi bacterium]|nr:polysaccharide pyruvyl transferase family protein [Chloroflexota bacterium]
MKHAPGVPAVRSRLLEGDVWETVTEGGADHALGLRALFGATDGVDGFRKKLLRAIDGAPDVTLVRSVGNVGDQLIYAGTRRLLAGIRYKEVSVLNVAGTGGHTALLSGGGAWCEPYHELLPAVLPLIEERFERVIILPSSFDVSVDCVREALENTRALVLARERVSYQQIGNLCNADIAHDCALFFDFRPYRCNGSGLLKAYRTDKESARQQVPAGNDDISVTCESLDQWLWTMARYEAVETDRAHVMIAAAMLGKRVEYSPSQYHKVPAIAEFSLSRYPVRRKTREEQ